MEPFGLCHPALLPALLLIMPTLLRLTMACMFEVFQATIRLFSQLAMVPPNPKPADLITTTKSGLRITVRGR
jgi:hypothetical protein